MKVKIFYTINFVFLIIFYFLIDFTLSNTIYKNNHCFNHFYFENGFYYNLKKNCFSKYRFKSGFPSVDLFTDNKGLRVSKNDKKKDLNKENIFLFGDSFTFGVGLNYEDTFSGIIEKKFPEYNFYNFAVGSYSPTVYLFRLNNALKENVIPKKIFLFLDLTDVIDEARRWVDDKEKNMPVRPEKSFLKKRSFLHNNFKLSLELVNLVRFSLRNIKSKIYNLTKKTKSKKIKTSIQGQFTYVSKKNLDERFWNNNDFDNGIKKIEDKINKISSLANKVNSKLYLVVYPWAETIRYGQSEFSWSNFAKTLCKKNVCTTIDAIPEFIKYQKLNKYWSSQLYFTGDEHFNKGGAEFLANVVIANFDK